MVSELCFDVLDDLSDELGVSDMFWFVLINDITSELEYRTDRFVEYFYSINDRYNGGLLRKSPYIYDSAWKKVFKIGNLKVIEWFCKNHTICCYGYANHKHHMVARACYEGRKDVMDWICDFYFPYSDDWKPRLVRYAVSKRRLDVVEQLSDDLLRNTPMYIRKLAVVRGYYDVAVWIDENIKNDK